MTPKCMNPNPLPNNYLFPLPDAQPAHPAQYTEALYPTMARMLAGCMRILDPFGGKGGVFVLERWLPQAEICAVELEPEWAACHPKTEQGNALHLRWSDNYFDAVCTSPTYGNRMADVTPGRISYAAYLGEKLSPDNSGAMQWGDKYRAFHVAAWTEARRVLAGGGVFVLNIKDHIRNSERQYVTAWHIQTLETLGFRFVEHEQIACPGMRWGANSEARVEYESVIKFIKEQPHV